MKPKQKTVEKFFEYRGRLIYAWWGGGQSIWNGQTGETEVIPHKWNAVAGGGKLPRMCKEITGSLNAGTPVPEKANELTLTEVLAGMAAEIGLDPEGEKINVSTSPLFFQVDHLFFSIQQTTGNESVFLDLLHSELYPLSNILDIITFPQFPRPIRGHFLVGADYYNGIAESLYQVSWNAALSESKHPGWPQVKDWWQQESGRTEDKIWVCSPASWDNFQLITVPETTLRRIFLLYWEFRMHGKASFSGCRLFKSKSDFIEAAFPGVAVPRPYEVYEAYFELLDSLVYQADQELLTRENSRERRRKLHELRVQLGWLEDLPAFEKAHQEALVDYRKENYKWYHRTPTQELPPRRNFDYEMGDYFDQIQQCMVFFALDAPGEIACLWGGGEEIALYDWLDEWYPRPIKWEVLDKSEGKWTLTNVDGQYVLGLLNPNDPDKTPEFYLVSNENRETLQLITAQPRKWCQHQYDTYLRQLKGNEPHFAMDKIWDIASHFCPLLKFE